MADEITSQRHAELAAEHKRKSEWHSGLAGGSSVKTPSAGEQAGGFLGAIMEHKWIFIGGVAAIIGLFLLFRSSSSSQGSSTANQSPDLSQGGFVPSNISTALDSINAGIAGLGNQIAQNQTSSTTSVTPVPEPITPKPAPSPIPVPNPVSNPPPISLPPPPPPPPQPQYVTVTPWPTTLSTLWGISQSRGISLARIESLNPQIPNPNLIYPGQQVRVS